MNCYTLTPNIFNSKTLVVLKLKLLQISSNNLCVDLPSLKTLHLESVSFENENDFIKLLFGCPILEYLYTYPITYVKRVALEEFKSLFLLKLMRAEISSNEVPLNVINNVEFLRINCAKEATLRNIPVFRNLIHIELLFYDFFYDHDWDGVVELLQSCPKLQILLIRKWNRSKPKDWGFPFSVIECVSSHLRSCTILNFEECDNDLRFATYILENARFLQDMAISVSTTSSNYGLVLEKSQTIKELSICPRISPGCKLSFQAVFIRK